MLAAIIYGYVFFAAYLVLWLSIDSGCVAVYCFNGERSPFVKKYIPFANFFIE